MARNVENLLAEAEEALSAGEPETALQRAGEVARLEPDNPDGHYLCGEALLDLGEPARAEQAYRIADRLLPGDGLILSGLGLALFEQARLSEADAVLRRAHSANSDLAEVHWALSILDERRGKDRSARRHLERAVLLAPEDFHLPIEIPQADFDDCVERALLELPEPVRRAIENTPVLVETFPAEADLRAADPALSPEILGMFRGHSLREESLMDPNTLWPGEIVLYQKNLERFARTREDLVAEIRKTVLHEVGHRLGLSEEDLEDRGLG